MRILCAHNSYLTSGGEDIEYRREVALLRKYGHEVVEYAPSSERIWNMGRVELAVGAIWSSSAYHLIRDLVQSRSIDIVHFHNTIPLISPSGYYAARAAGAAVVQTLHNYRLLCPAGTLFRDNRVCETCIGRRFAWPAIVHACHRDSVTSSAVVATMLSAHRMLHTWSEHVDAYIVLTDFMREKIVGSGLPADKVKVKPNLAGGLYAPKRVREREYGLFVGRLSHEKGVELLLRAWKRAGIAVPLVIAGAGPLAGAMAAAAEGLPVEFVGWLSESGISQLMAGATMLLVPSEWYECFPLVVVEAFASGLAVIASDHGSIAKLVEHGETGLRFRVGDERDLSDKIRWAFEHSAEMREMGARARGVYEEEYTAARNYKILMEIYENALRVRVEL